MTGLLRFRAARMWSSVALLTIAAATASVRAQQLAGSDQGDAGAAKGCAMMAQHDETMAAMAAGDQKLTALVARMHSANGHDKLDAIAEVVSEIVAQRTLMTKMQSGMKEQMKAHRSAKHGADGAMRHGPEPATGATAADHAGHHPQK
jgi:hypothetical protein